VGSGALDLLSRPVGPSTTDLPLLQELGLKPFSAQPCEETYLGQVSFEDGSKASIWVTAMPATFWRFEIFCARSGKTFTSETGSGDLNDYWNLVRAVAEDSFDPKTMEVEMFEVSEATRS
jgi:hypothetical protein